MAGTIPEPQKCLDSSSTFCRSVEYAPEHRKCVVSDEDTFSRADKQGEPHYEAKDYYEPVCVAADLSSSVCRQQAAFDRFIGTQIHGDPVSMVQGTNMAECISLCFQNLDCKSINYDRSELVCYIYDVSRESTSVSTNPAMDYYEFNCESQFGGMALCTNEGIRFIVNTKQPYTGAVYAAEKFSTCSQVVQNAKQIQMLFPPPTVTSDCGTVLKNGRIEATVVVSLDGVIPHQVTTEWDRFYRISCETNLKGLGEGSVIVTTLYETGDAEPEILPAGTPAPVSATLAFLDKDDYPVLETSIGQQVNLVVTSAQSGPRNMVLLDCTATRVGGTGGSVPFKVVESGCPLYPALVGPVVKDFQKNRLVSEMKAFRLDGSFDIQMVCQVMFCAGPAGCPPRDCLDSGTNNLFGSYGRKKRSVEENGDAKTDDNSEETVLATLRVFAEGEQAEFAEIDFKNSDKNDERSQNIMQAGRRVPETMLCMAHSAFVSILVSVSLLCVVFSAIIVVWGCRKAKAFTERQQIVGAKVRLPIVPVLGGV